MIIVKIYGSLATGVMIMLTKITMYEDIAFFYRKANILHRLCNILLNSTGTKACVTSADLIDSDENMHCFTLPLSSCNIKISLCLSAGFSWLFCI